MRTKRLSIEVAEKKMASRLFWTDSGIMSCLNPWLYIQGNRQILFIFATKTLRAWMSKNNPPVIEKRQPNPTIKTFYIPIDEAERIALKVVRFEDIP
jgi:hypothetical protein